MIWLGEALIAVGILGFMLHKKSSDFTILDEDPSGNSRVINKFVVFKFLPDKSKVMRFALLERKNIVQIKSIGDNETWLDIGWAN